MYFLAKVRGKHLVDPFNQDDDILYASDSDSNNPYDKDSQDSNRESAEQNDYPDEELDSDDHDNNGYYSEDSEDRKKKKQKRKDDVPLGARWLDILLRKQKNGVTQAKTIK